ncbi:hypothetical protein KUCAC02_000723, partial [Chaenocephalus aceratus]
WSWRIMQLCLNPVPSYLAPTRPTQSNTRGEREHPALPSPPDPSMNPCITQPAIT